MPTLAALFLSLTLFLPRMTYGEVAGEVPEETMPAAPDLTGISTDTAPGTFLGMTVSTLPAHVQIALAYGVERTHEIEELKYTFHVQNGPTDVRREWHWDLARNQVSYKGQDLNGNVIEHTYSRDKIGQGEGALNKNTDDLFVKDQYWLLFPFHLDWNKNIEVSADGKSPLPIAPGSAERLTVRFPDAGSLPAEHYEVYYSPTYMIQEWTCRNSREEPRVLSTTWSNHAKAGPILVSLTRESLDGSVRISFEDVAVKTVDGAWHSAVLLDQLSRL